MVNYRTTYNRFISSAKKKMVMCNIDSKLKAYNFQRKNKLEIHHIVPKILGGGKKFKNLVLLSHDDHIYAHFLLNMALFQEGRYGKLAHLGYSAFPAGMLEMLKTRKNVLRGLKVDVFVAGKHRDPTKMGIREIAKVFCVMSRQNYTDQLLFDEMVTKVMRAALFSKSIHGITLKLSM